MRNMKIQVQNYVTFVKGAGNLQPDFGLGYSRP